MRSHHAPVRPRLAQLGASALLGLACLAFLGLARPAAAQAPPLELALEINAKSGLRGQKDAPKSIARQVATHLIPRLEAQGWRVERVFSARKAARRERCHAAVRIDIDAEAVYHVHDARIYEDEDGKTLVTDYSKSARAWGDWIVWDGMERDVITEGQIFPVLPGLQAAGAGRPELDDEASIARLVADAMGKTLLDALSYARATQP